MLVALILFSTPLSAVAYRAQARTLVEAGEELLKMNRLEEAEMKFLEAKEEDVTFDKTYYCLARVAMLRNNFKEARLHIDKAIANSPHDKTYKVFLADLNIQLAAMALKDGNASEALEYYEKNKDLVEFHLPTWNRLAGYQISRNEFQTAEKTCDQALRKLHSSSVRWDPAEVAILHANLAVSAFKTGNFVRAMNEIRVARNRKEELDIVRKYNKLIYSEENPVILHMNRAEAARDSKKFDEALKEYAEVLKFHPNYTEAQQQKQAIENRYRIDDLFSAARELLEKEDYFKAESVLDEILSIDPENKKVPEIKTRIKQLVEKRELQLIANRKQELKPLEDKQKSEALAELARQQAREENPEEALRLKYQRAEQLYIDQKYDEALVLFLEIKATNPDYEDVLKRVSLIYTAQGMIFLEFMDQAYPKVYFYIAAIIFILLVIWYFVGDHVRNWFVPDPRKFYKKAVSQMESGRYKPALKNLAKALSISGNIQEGIRIKEKIVQCYYSSKDFKACIQHGKEVLDRDPRNDKVITLVGESYLEQQATHEDALNIYRRMWRIRKDDPRLLNILSMTYLNEQSLASEAVEVYEKVFIKNPGDKGVRRLLCEAYVRANNRNEGAIRVFEGQLEDEPERLEVRTLLIAALYQRNRFDRALEHCLAVFDQGVYDEFTLEYLKNCHEKLGKQEEMPEIYRKLLEKFPQETKLKAALEKVTQQIDVRRLAGQSQAPPSAGEQTATKPAAGGPKICVNCAHINPPGLSKCEKCFTPFQ